jgi:hypothetical protein
VVDETHPYGNIEWGVQLAKIREADPGFIFCVFEPDVEAISFVRQFLEDPTQSLIVIQCAWAPVEFRTELGDQSIGVMGHGIVQPNPSREYREFREAYNERWGRFPGKGNPNFMWDSVMMWAEAVEAVGDETDYRAIMDYIMTHPYKGLCYGPEGTNFSPLSGTDRMMWFEGMPEFDRENRATSLAAGSTYHLIQVKETSWGLECVVLYIHGIPADEYMQEYYGYPPADDAIEEVGCGFELPPWIEK